MIKNTASVVFFALTAVLWAWGERLSDGVITILSIGLFGALSIALASVYIRALSDDVKRRKLFELLKTSAFFGLGLGALIVLALGIVAFILSDYFPN